MLDSAVRFRKRQKRRRIFGKITKFVGIFFGVVLLSLILFLTAEIWWQESMHKKEMADVEMMTVPEIEEVVVEDKGQTITYKGEKYLYNENIKTILCMGIDSYEMAGEDKLIGEAGQADMILLAILDTENGSVKLWNISRDSMTDIDIYNVYGEYVRTEKMQACLAFAYGDGKEKSCENTVRAVSRLLYGIPIQSYAVLNMEAIIPLNNAVGGVEVTIREGDILPAKFRPGTTVLLEGDDVEAYVRARRTELPGEPIDSNNNRMDRQRQYMMNFIQKALKMTKEDLSIPVKLFRIAKENDNMITDLTVPKITSLAVAFSNVSLDEADFMTVPGKVLAGKEYAEYHVDDEELYRMILDAFYIKQ